MGKRKGATAVMVLLGWLKRLSKMARIALGVVVSLILIVALKYTVKDFNYFFIASESIRAAGILVLLFKLFRKKTCSGLSLKSQEITAIFLAVRIICSFVLRGDIHTVLDSATLALTLLVIYMIRFKLKSSYVKELDNLPIYYVIIPCVVMAILVHPEAPYPYMAHYMMAFAVYLEAVSVLPQLRLMQNAKMIEPFTAHYVFALGMARFLGCAHWLIQVYESSGAYLWLIGAGYFWLPMAVLAEFVQTFILADFCYYYVKSVMDGQLVMRMPV